MNYILIFVLKVMENALSTLRLILVSNGRKLLGSILLLMVSVVWIISSSIAIINISIQMIIIFALGSLIGSYIGSLLEEKLALGNNLIICISEKNICLDLRKNGYIVTMITGKGLNNEKEVLLIAIKRKKNNELIRYISSLDSKAIIISEPANFLN